MKFYLKIHTRSNQSCIGVCDEDILGKNLKDEELKFNISEHFFKGDLVSKDKAINVLRKANNYNIVGKNICEILIKEKILHRTGVKTIEGVPIALKFVL